MTNQRRADIIAWIHFLWVLFGLVSLPLLLVIDWWGKIVLVFAGITVLSWLIFRGCWLQQLENKWRKRQGPGEAFEDEAFVQHYLKKYLNISCSRLSVRIVIYSYLAVLTCLSIAQTF